MNKTYDILLDQNKIGTTELEKADASMGVVFGKIEFINLTSGYDFIKNYCSVNNICFTDYPEDNHITTQNIPNIQVLDKDRNEIKGLSTEISGMDTDEFEITIVGIAYPFYEEEFPHHVKAYNEMHL